MDDKIHVVQQDPLRLPISFQAVGMQSGFAQAPLYFVRDSLDLARIGSGTYDEVIGECAGSAVHFQDGQVFTFLAFNSLDGSRYLLTSVFFLRLAHSLLPVS